MRKFVQLAVVLLLAAILRNGSSSALYGGEVLWMAFEDDASDGVLDSSSNGHHGACTNCPERTTDAKVGTYAYEFDRGEYFGISPTAGTDLESQALTIAFWVKVLDAVDIDTLLGLCSPESSAGPTGYRFIYVEEQNAIKFELGHVPPGGYHGLRTRVKAKEEIELGEWVHIAGRWDGENLGIFVNGVLSNENYFKNMDAGTNPVVYECIERELYIGSAIYYYSHPSSERHSNMIMDDLRMYDRALSDAEVAELACGEDGACTSGTRSCPKQLGVCAGSQQTCSASAWPGCYDADYLAWNGQYEAQESLCGDGLDNDCDGKTDREDEDCRIIEVSRDSGVAPLAVYFDGISDHSWETIEGSEFVWDFGDGSPEFTGYMAAHVYELDDAAPETVYTATLTIKQNGSVVDSDTRAITVSPFGGRTICVSPTSDFAACPSASGSDHYTNLGTAWAAVGTNTRLLLHRGESWVSGVPLEKSQVPGPVIVGAYDTGARPSVTFTDLDEPTFFVESSPDWRFVDLHIEGGGDQNGGGFGSTCGLNGGGCKDLLILRTHMEGNMALVTVPGVRDGFFIVDSTFENLADFMVYNYYGEHIALVNVTGHEVGSRFYRIGGHDKLLISGNDLSDPNTGSTTTHDTLTLRGGGYYSRYTLLSGNTLRKPGWLVQCGSQDGLSAGPLRYLVAEGNTFAPYPGDLNTGTGFILDGYDAAIRNNSFVNTGDYAIVIGERHQFDDSRRIGVYNNSVYLSADMPWGASFIHFDSEANPQDIKVHNNVFDTEEGAWWIYTGTGIDVAEIDSDNNIWNGPTVTFFGHDLATWQTTYGQDTNSLTADPQFVSHDPSHADFMTLEPHSPAIDAGATVPVPTDCSGNSRPQDGDGDGNALWDIGAYEWTPELALHGSPADRAIHLDWTVNISLPVTSTWRITYYSQTVAARLTEIDPYSATRAYTLTNLVNYAPYTVTLNAMLGSSPILTDTITVTPTDIFVYLPLIQREDQ